MDVFERNKEINEAATQQFLIEQFAQYVFRPCKCGAILEKEGGCNYVQCLFCKYEICWECGLEKFVIMGCNNKDHHSHSLFSYKVTPPSMP